MAEERARGIQLRSVDAELRNNSNIYANASVRERVTPPYLAPRAPHSLHSSQIVYEEFQFVA